MSSANGNASAMGNIENCSLILVDVAGTTTSINFLKNDLFPFAVKEAEAFLQAKWDDETVKECIEAIKEKDELDAKTAAERIKTLTEENSSNEGFKKLQGLIFENGYEKGDLKAHVFEDVPEMFEVWAQNKKIAVYSTGSVDSQKQLFSHTIFGDLSNHITSYFDQAIGLKTDPESYKKIAKELEVQLGEVLFITDDLKEAEAAKASGVQAVLISREKNSSTDEETSKQFTVITSFKNLSVEKLVKRKNDDQSIPEEPPAKIVKTDDTKEEEKTELNPKTDEKIEEAQNVDSKIVETEEMEVDTIENEKTDPKSQNNESETMEVDANVEKQDSTETTRIKTIEKVESQKTETIDSQEKNQPSNEAQVEKASSLKEEDSATKVDNATEDATKLDIVEKDSKAGTAETSDISVEHKVEEDKAIVSTTDKEETKDCTTVEEKQEDSKSNDFRMETETTVEKEPKNEIAETAKDASLPEVSDSDSTKKDLDLKTICSEAPKCDDASAAKEEKQVTDQEALKSGEEGEVVKNESNGLESKSKEIDIKENKESQLKVDENTKGESSSKSSEVEEKKETHECKTESENTTEQKVSEQKEDTTVQESFKTDDDKTESLEKLEKQEVNGDNTVETTESVKTDEKENNSVLANGVENGKDESETKENLSEVAETKTEEVGESEAKLKKLEAVVESPAVSVEV